MTITARQVKAVLDGGSCREILDPGAISLVWIFRQAGLELHVKALLDNLREAELDLPVLLCDCWFWDDLVVESFATVTAEKIVIHNPPAPPPDIAVPAEVAR